MSKFAFPKVREYYFASLEELVCDIIDEFKNNSIKYTTVVVSADEVASYIKAFLSTDMFLPVYLDYDSLDYGAEYNIVLEHDGSLWVEKSWSEDSGEYYPNEQLNDILFVSQSISKQFYDVINDGKTNIVSYDIDE